MHSGLCIPFRNAQYASGSALLEGCMHGATIHKWIRPFTVKHPATCGPSAESSVPGRPKAAPMRSRKLHREAREILVDPESRIIELYASTQEGGPIAIPANLNRTMKFPQCIFVISARRSNSDSSRQAISRQRATILDDPTAERANTLGRA